MRVCPRCGDRVVMISVHGVSAVRALRGVTRDDVGWDLAGPIVVLARCPSCDRDELAAAKTRVRSVAEREGCDLRGVWREVSE